MRTADPTSAVSWRKRSRKRPRCPFVSYKQPAAPPSEGDAARRGGAAGGGGPCSSRRSGPLGPHACPPALSEPQVRGRRGARPRGWAGAAGAMCERRRGAGCGRGRARCSGRVRSGLGPGLFSGLGESLRAALSSTLEHCGSPRGGLGLKGALEATWGRLQGLWATLLSGS